MTDVAIPWAPRVVLCDRVFRLPVVAAGEVRLQASGFDQLDRRYSQRDGAWYFYLRTPATAGRYRIEARTAETPSAVAVDVTVADLGQLRAPHHFNGVDWPRRWPLGAAWLSTKRRQTLKDLAAGKVDEVVLNWWLRASDDEVWQALPKAEFPQAHYVNVRQGCPRCGTAIFAHHGFYPWQWPALEEGFKARCPACGLEAPSNDLAAGDFTSGPLADDGFGYFDEDGRIYLFAATRHRNQVSAFGGGIAALTARLRQEYEPQVACRLGLMLLRYAVETCYVAAVPQFRYGPSKEAEEPWDWGQTDWAVADEPVAALYRKGMLRYSIDVPIVAEGMALAYDTLWPYMQGETGWIDAANAQGLALEGPAAGMGLIEEMLACQLQCLMDGGGLSNLPRTSVGALVLLRCLDRDDAQAPMDWLYDHGHERLRVFATNNFFPDGTPPEATGGYNNTHTRGLFDLEHHLRALRSLHPRAYPLQRYPSLTNGERAVRIALAPYETVLLGRAVFGFGDGASAGVQGPLPDQPHEPLDAEAVKQAMRLTQDKAVARLAYRGGQYQPLGTTVHDGVGFAILRTGENPERAAAGIVYGDASLHRHRDLMDVQLFAHGRPFLSDLGYPQSWASVDDWEGHWATHNSMWGVVPGVEPLELPYDTPYFYLKALAGRGCLRHLLQADGVQVVEVEAQRWAWDMARRRWYRPGVHIRRLLALVETDGDGVALVDLARVRGGGQHWRCCRGLEGNFIGGENWRQQPGTLAGQKVERGQLEAVSHRDLAGLAYMDQVALHEGDALQGHWLSRHEGGVRLDLHTVGVTPGTNLMRARATAVMGAPEESKYCYQALAWERRPQAEDEPTCIDLVFEPRVGPSCLTRVAAIEGEDPEAAGVELQTAAGRSIRLYWSPAADGVSRFADGTEMDGALGAEIDGRLYGMGGQYVGRGNRRVRSKYNLQTGRIAALDRDACTVEIEAADGVEVGDRLALPAAQGGRTYRVDAVDRIAADRQRLKLDISSVLGRSQIVEVDGVRLRLGHFILARTAYLHGACLEMEEGEGWGRITSAFNPDAGSTEIELERPLPGLAAGQWVRAVSYVVGDRFACAPLYGEEKYAEEKK